MLQKLKDKSESPSKWTSLQQVKDSGWTDLGPLNKLPSLDWMCSHQPGCNVDDFVEYYYRVSSALSWRSITQN